ncbi:MAG: fimbrial protein [Serratia sp. (in: enterobacteria)]|uniref:fimbrial protein n=1 Tax=Serratia sp. (in: enterobacteria) TaxID=616 RepID=UPI003F313FA9
MKVNIKYMVKISRGWEQRISLKHLLSGILMLMIAPFAKATCPLTFNLTSAIPTVNISPAVPLNTILASTTVSFPLTSGGCDKGSGNKTSTIVGVGTPNGNLYPTSIPGVSYRGKLDANWPGYPNSWWPSSRTWTGRWPGSYAASTVTIEFVKTGPIPGSAGTFGPGVIGNISVDGSLDIILYLATTLIIQPTTPACTVTQSNIPVNLEDTTTANLNIINSTTGDKGFTIPLQCDSLVNLSLSFSGTMASSNNTVFKNTNSSTADNVGFQLLDQNGNVITPSTYINVGNVNGTFNYPMTARYYALTADVPAGPVNAIAYATIVYN